MTRRGRGSLDAEMVPVLVGLISIAVGLYVSTPLLEGNDWNPSILISSRNPPGAARIRRGNAR